MAELESTAVALNHHVNYSIHSVNGGLVIQSLEEDGINFKALWLLLTNVDLIHRGLVLHLEYLAGL